MYTIIFIAAFLTSRYLWYSRRVLAAHIVLAITIVTGCVVFSMALKDKMWQPINGAFFSALMITLLVELYIKLGRFEVKK